jgi:hypothetical protein
LGFSSKESYEVLVARKMTTKNVSFYNDWKKEERERDGQRDVFFDG